MSQKLPNFTRKLSSLQNTAYNELLTIVNNKGDEIVEINKDNLSKGKLSDGNLIVNLDNGRLDYSNGYAEQREAANLQTDHVDLKFSQKFYDSIRYKKTEQGGQIKTVDRNKDKIKDIDRRYGPDVLGVEDKQLNKIAEESAEELAAFIINKLSD